MEGEGTGAVSRQEGEITAEVCEDTVSLEIFHAFARSDDRMETQKAVKNLAALGRDKLLADSAAAWKELWKRGLAFETEDFEIAQNLIAHQYYLLSSLECGANPLAPLGLSHNEWGGNQLWDADLWVFRAILPLWPEYARSIIDFRYRTLESAKEHAYVSGYNGAWYPWMGDEEGHSMTPTRYREELHVNIWIALAGWEYYLATKDRDYLKDCVWPIMSGIADFFVSRIEMRNDGKAHLVCVVGPDESVCESPNAKMRVNDHFSTNVGVQRMLRCAIEAADILGEEPGDGWAETAEKMYLLSPDENGVYPEYYGYDGHVIKQTDVLFAFYPLKYEASADCILKNVEYYRSRIDRNGPMMSAQIDSCLVMKLGGKEAGLKVLFYDVKRYNRGPHYIPFESVVNQNSIMMTGIAGELQALIYGYYEAEPDQTEQLPRLGQYMEE